MHFPSTVVIATWAVAVSAAPYSSPVNISQLPPTQDPFYDIPSNISAYERGAIIRVRPLPSSVQFGDDAGQAHQLVYRTEGLGGKADATVTTVIAPKHVAKGRPKIVAVAAPQDNAAFDCSTSWALYPETASNQQGVAIFPIHNARAALYNGYYVTIPDLEGSKAAWLTYGEGHAILDGIRAIVNHRATIPDSLGYKAALVGYSGGGHGSAWAAQLASSYGKGIPIVAMAAGGIPVDLETSFEFLDGTAQSYLVMLLMTGLANGYPALNDFYQRILKPNGTDAFAKLRMGDYCTFQAAEAFSNKSFNGSTTLRHPNKAPLPQRVFDENYLGRHQRAITQFPVYITHGREDVTVPFGPVLDYYHGQCAQGASVLFSALPKGGHGDTDLGSVVSHMSFINAAFNGERKLDGCRLQSTLLAPLSSDQAAKIVGQALLDELRATAASL